MNKTLERLFGLQDKVVAITGAGGVLCSEMARAAAELGAKVAVLDRSSERGQEVAQYIRDRGGVAKHYVVDVLERNSLVEAEADISRDLGPTDILINGAGGNRKEATTTNELSFFDLPAEAVRWVFDLNLLGTLIPCQVFGRGMAGRNEGVILNISSMNAFRPLTRIPAYSAAKAAVTNFTQWLAAHMAQEYSAAIRVNAIAPGFFLTDQNRFLLTNAEGGSLTERGKTIVGHTPMNRFGEPNDLISTVIWLVGPGSKFVSGVVVPVDGGFSAFSGV